VEEKELRAEEKEVDPGRLRIDLTSREDCTAVIDISNLIFSSSHLRRLFFMVSGTHNSPFFFHSVLRLFFILSQRRNNSFEVVSCNQKRPLQFTRFRNRPFENKIALSLFRKQIALSITKLPFKKRGNCNITTED
jgi:hypothetical protein